MRKFQDFTSMLPSIHPEVWKDTVVHGKVIFPQFQPKRCQGIHLRNS